MKIKINENALKCPCCGEKISLLNKLWLDSRYKRRCNKCKAFVTLPKWVGSYYVISVTMSVIVIMILRKYYLIKRIFGGIYILITMIIALFFIPIIRKEDQK